VSTYDDDSQQEYRSALAEQGYPELDFDENLEDALDQLSQDLEQCPQGIQEAIEAMMKGSSFQDAIYQAGYCNNSEQLYHVVGANNGMRMSDKLQHFKQTQQGARQRADDRMSQAAQQGEGYNEYGEAQEYQEYQET
jgi:hypothetical protein